MSDVDTIVRRLVETFATFGGPAPRERTENPVLRAFHGQPVMFAAGVDVRQVVEVVLACEAEGADVEPRR